MTEPKPLLVRILMWIDPAVFYAIFFCFKTVFTIVDRLLDFVVGYSLVHGWKSDRSTSGAHLVNVLGRGTFNFASRSFLSNFCYSHAGYIDPEDVLRRDDVTLQGFDESHVWFCVTEENVYDMKEIPFAFLNQFIKAKQLVIMNHETFIRLAKTMNQSRSNLTVIQMSIRSGSTLLCQMIARTPEIRVLSEPWALLYLHELYNTGKIDMRTYTRLFQAGLLVQTKPVREKQNEKILLKLPGLQLPQTSLIHELFPEVKIVFSTRLPKPSIVSFLKVLRMFPFTYRIFKLGNDFLYNNLPFPYGDPSFRRYWEKNFAARYNMSSVRTLTMSFAGVFACYRQMKDLFCQTVLYEDLVARPKEVLDELFKVLDIPADHVELALHALKQNSQNNLFGDTAGNDDDFVTKSDRVEVDQVFRELGQPLTVDMSVKDMRNLLDAAQCT